MNTTEIDTAIHSILTRPNLPRNLLSRANRFRAGKLGLASKLSILEKEGYLVEIIIHGKESKI